MKNVFRIALIGSLFFLASCAGSSDDSTSTTSSFSLVGSSS